MPDFVKKFIVESGSKVKLRDVDPDYCGKLESHAAALPEIQDQIRKMDHLQYLLYAEKKHALLVVLQGMDAAGKDGVVRHVIAGMNPAGCKVVAFKQPTEAERDHDFLWRVHPHVPKKGEAAIFNRSHYEDVLVVRVHELVTEKVWSKRYDLINEFEQLLAVENNTTILKFFLYISRQEQLARFKQRLDDPARHWKISDADYQEREYWDDYMAAYEDMLRKTSTDYAPWFVIPANHKWFRDLAISKIITKSLEDLDMQFPGPTVDIAEIARKFHAAAGEKDATNERRNKASR
jgi:PPK2 family polyphosphate:nucleotide phosphotransferase